MPQILSRWRRKPKFEEALYSLQIAFEEEAARQRRETIAYARLKALKDREEIFQRDPVSWPATITENMNRQHGAIYGLHGLQ
jgi:hypothetical protein